MNDKLTVVSWTTILSALLGLIGGALSGGFAAYTQLSTAREQYSIDRANLFRDLIKELQAENTARMALLNLWQLYPQERDKKIIVAAAIESGHPDIVESLIGFENELVQLAEILAAKASEGGSPALQALTKIDPPRAAQVMMENIQSYIRSNGESFFMNDAGIKELIKDFQDLVQENYKAAERVGSKSREMDEVPLLLDYILYDAGQDSNFVQRMEQAYKSGTELRQFNEFLSLANIKPDDASKIFASVREFIVNRLKDSKYRRKGLAGAIAGLENNSFQDFEYFEDNKSFAADLRKTVENAECPDYVREKALSLLQKISRLEAILAIALVLSKDTADVELSELINKSLPGLISRLNDSDRNFEEPGHCVEVEFNNCIGQAEEWNDWLKGMEGS